MSYGLGRTHRAAHRYPFRIDRGQVHVTFHGVRGSTPCDGPELQRYGGNTSCVHVDVPENPPILFDMGTGARQFGTRWPADRPFDGVCLLTHLHWDHVLGLPFFPCTLRPGSRMVVHGPRQDDGLSLDDAFGRMLCPPFFPVKIDALPGDITFVDHVDDEFMVGDVRVTARQVPHIGPTLGYRLDWNGASVAYLSDHQQPHTDRYEIPDGVRELCDSVDLLIHDAQFTPDEFEVKAHWGHCTVDFACWVAQECNAKALALFHHDPSHGDEQLDAMTAEAQVAYPDLTILAARERCSFPVGR